MFFSWKQTSRGLGQQTENSPSGLKWHLWVEGHDEPMGPHCTVWFPSSDILKMKRLAFKLILNSDIDRFHFELI